jgi:predicted transposase/invertase (TIGR01784 family)
LKKNSSHYDLTNCLVRALERQNAIDFLKVAVPANILSLMELDSLMPSQNSYITEDIRELFSDIVFTCKLNSGKEAYCSILIEHKSYKDPLVGFQIGGYIFGGYLQQIKSKEPFRVIIPLVFYHHEDKWAYRPIESYFEDIPEELRKFIPRFDVLFFDVKQLSDETIFDMRNTAMTTMFITQKHHSEPIKLLDRMEKIYESLQTQEERNSFERNFVYLLIAFKKNDQIIDIIQKSKNKPINNVFMTLYESLISEGVIKGEIKGRAEGRAEGREEGRLNGKIEVILNGFDKGHSISLLANITDFMEDEVRRILKDHKRIE